MLNNKRHNRIQITLALIWLGIVAAIIWQQWGFWQHARINSDIMALLPLDEHQPMAQTATDRLLDNTARQVFILVNDSDWEKTKKAAANIQQAMRQTSLRPVQDKQTASALFEFYRPWQNRLLTASQRAELDNLDTIQLGPLALQRLYQPTNLGLSSWAQDPIGLWPTWWQARQQEANVQLQEGYLSLYKNQQHWILLRYQIQGPAFDASAQRFLTQAIDQASLFMHEKSASAKLVWSGIPRYAEAAASQANHEMSTIGLGSLLAVLLAVWLCFRSLQPIALTALSLFIGCLAALAVTSLFFDQIHVLTLVFGASLVGVAEDYGFHYFSAKQGQAKAQNHRILQNLLPGMLLALITSVLAYLTLGLAPFPGLRQMAVFSAAGLVAAFLTVICWFPLLARNTLADTAFSYRFSTSLHAWPRLKNNHITWLSLSILSIVTIIGLMRLSANDDLRQLQSIPTDLLADQKTLESLLAPPSPAQFFLISGTTPEEMLQNEEKLTAELDQQISLGTIKSYLALSDWLPSQARQAENARLHAKVDAKAKQYIEEQLGEPPPAAVFTSTPLTLEQWKNAPLPEELKSRWLGEHQGMFFSLVQLKGLKPDSLIKLKTATSKLSGVQWIDKTADISKLMARYRFIMTALLVLGHVTVFITLTLRYGKEAWRAWLPTAFGCLLTLSLLGMMGEPLQLFVILALLVLLGMGIDYGIFLLEHPGDGRAWLAVALAGLSTLLSFGLLALSSTPALRSFGLTMLIGEILIWFLTPLFRLQTPPPNISEKKHT